MKRLWILVAATLMLLSSILPAAQAVPAYPGAIILTDADGNHITAYNHGDEFFSYFTDASDRLLYRTTGGSVYLVVDKNGAYALGARVTSSAVPYSAGGDEPVSLSGGEIPADLQQKLRALTISLNSTQQAVPNAPAFTVIPDEYDYQNDPMNGKLVQSPDNINAPQMGSTCHLVVLRVNFADVKCQFTDAQWNQRIFHDGVSHYYTDVSNGKFTYIPALEQDGTPDDGVMTAELPLLRPCYQEPNVGQNYSNGAEVGLYTGTDGVTKYAIYNESSFFAYALDAVKDKIDFASYDKNQDGFVSPTELAFLVIAAGYEAAYVGPQAGKPMTWAHSWITNSWRFKAGTMDEYAGSGACVLLDGVKLYKYTILGENLNGLFDYTTTSPQTEQPIQAPIGTACHELGHDQGLVDLYDTGRTRQRHEVGMLSVMASGSWGTYGGQLPGTSPTHMDPYSKIFLGFYQPKTVKKSGTYRVTEASDSANYNILRINTENPDVYYLIENRTFTGYDRGLEYGYSAPGGVVYWRIDERVIRDNWYNNSINNHNNHYGVMPVYITDYASNEPFRNANTYTIAGDYLAQGEPKITLRSRSTTNGTMNVVVNLYPPTPTPPKTGDEANPALWIAICVGCAALFAGMYFAWRKKSK